MNVDTLWGKKWPLGASIRNTRSANPTREGWTPLSLLFIKVTCCLCNMSPQVKSSLWLTALAYLQELRDFLHLNLDPGWLYHLYIVKASSDFLTSQLAWRGSSDSGSAQYQPSLSHPVAHQGVRGWGLEGKCRSHQSLAQPVTWTPEDSTSP